LTHKKRGKKKVFGADSKPKFCIKRQAIPGLAGRLSSIGNSDRGDD
jgi:hypothetical protein